MRRDKAPAARYKVATLLAVVIVVAGAAGVALEWRQTTERTAQLQAQASQQDAALEQIEQQREIALLEAAQKAQPKVDPEAHIPDAATDAGAVIVRR